MTGILFGALLLAVSTPAGFTDNLPAALEKAKAEKKSVFMVCSGSDWCGWCRKLEAEVLSDPSFIPAVKDAFELVYIDMPQDTSLLSDWGKAHNEAVCTEYKVQGFPTCYILDVDGKVVSQLGYQDGGGAAYAKTLFYLKENQAAIDEYITPWQKKVRALALEMNKVFKSGKDGPKKMVRKYAPKVAALVKEIEALEVPAEIAGEKTMLVDRVKGMLEAVESLKASLDKTTK